MVTLFKSLSGLQLLEKCFSQSINLSVPNRGRRWCAIPKKRFPQWLPKQHRVLYNENLTKENKEFIDEVIESKFGRSKVSDPLRISPLKAMPIEPNSEWTPNSVRTGVIGKKIGVYPMWLKNGKKVSSTLIQIIDNHVVKYIPPEKYNPVKTKRNEFYKKNYGSLVVGADSADPQLFTKEYCNIFSDSGVMPTRVLMRFNITPNAALQPGTPLTAAHFKPGDVIDIRAKTIDRGFQGVMKRWGFSGMPATHGVTKSHRRGGNIGSGGTKARVMPGTKMPGHMGNRTRVMRGIRILRVNTKYNVIWILGQNLPGETNTYCQIYDTVLPLRKSKTAPHFPTYIPELSEEKLQEEMYAEDVHQFNEPTIMYKTES